MKKIFILLCLLVISFSIYGIEDGMYHFYPSALEDGISHPYLTSLHDNEFYLPDVEARVFYNEENGGIYDLDGEYISSYRIEFFDDGFALYPSQLAVTMIQSDFPYFESKNTALKKMLEMTEIAVYVKVEEE